MARVAAVRESDSPWEPVVPPPGLTPLRDQITPQNNQPDGGSATPVAAETPQDAVQRAREFSELIKRAGQLAGARQRGERYVGP
jgi:hypothetical protein